MVAPLKMDKIGSEIRNAFQGGIGDVSSCVFYGTIAFDSAPVFLMLEMPSRGV